MARPKRPRDSNQLAKLVVDISTGQVGDKALPERPKNPAAVALGRLGGLKGGKALASKLSQTERTTMARRAALARWRTKKR